MRATDRDRRSFDVLVLGGGLVGTSIAYALSERGVDVGLVERDEIGAGTSGRCDGNILVQTKGSEPVVGLTRASIELYRTWNARLPHPFRFERSGSLLAADDEHGFAALGTQVRWLQSLGVPVELLTPEELAQREPALARDLAGGAQCSADASVDPLGAVHAIAEGAVANGATIMTGVAVERILTGRDGAVRGVRTASGELGAQVVINALGVWADAVSRSVGVALPIQPRRGSLVVTERAPSLLRTTITEIGYVAQRYERDRGTATGGEADGAGPDVTFVAERTAAGNVLLGSSREFASFDLTTRPEVVRAIVRRAVRFVPALESVQVIRSFSGLRPYTPTGKPVIGRCAAVPGYIVAAGHEGEGVGLAPITGELVADLVCGRAPRFGLEEMAVPGTANEEVRT